MLVVKEGLAGGVGNVEVGRQTDALQLLVLLPHEAGATVRALQGPADGCVMLGA